MICSSLNLLRFIRPSPCQGRTLLITGGNLGAQTSLSELAALRGPLGLPVERDEWFQPDASLSVYAARARLAGRINS
ncbi:MAG: DUF2958 domain-containing protein [Novosphingobium sp.]|nr:DUF2958 domain-containing protein [Novosphingobium sp.]MCP5385439.1 DUF2958 domain-containing protein [Novosphingobium sp.]